VERKLASHQALSKIEAAVESEFANGRLYAVIASRPGQSGRADGYILEGEELSFYLRKMAARK
jgi:small subunit ribosomal protein S8e